MNNKGLTNSLVAIVVVLFVFGLLSLLAIRVWDGFNDNIQNLDSSIADNSTKDKISNLGTYIHWGDKLFTFFLIVLLIGYLVTSFTLPTQNSWMFLLFALFLIIITLLAMLLSNSWTSIISDPVFSAYNGQVPVTDYVLRHFPVFTFLIGIVGGVIFYSRSREDGGFNNPGEGGVEF